MIIDCHTHINCPSGSIDTADHSEACQKVDGCIVLTQSGGSADNNKKVSSYVSGKPEMAGFAALNPLEDKLTPKYIKSVTSDSGMAGFVLYCCEDKFHPANSRAMCLYESAEQLKMPLFFHNGPHLSTDAVLDYAQPYLLDEIARSFPALKIIIGQMGMPFLDQCLCMLAKHENVYADLTIQPDKVWQVYNIVVNAHETGVMDKLLFGSGYPFAKPANCIETLLGFNKLLTEASLPTVPREEIRAIIERDTFALLGIKTR
jgi:uncharacterized protein